MTDAPKHTPGPWADGGQIGYGRWIVGDLASIGKPAAQVAVAYGPAVNPQSEANIRLIVAAPDLLAALKMARECIAYCRRSHPDAQRGTGMPVEVFIDAAIAKAEGGGQ